MSGDIFSLVKPGDGARHAAERELRLRVERWGLTQFTYRGPADFILRNGRYYKPRVTPDEYRHLYGETQQCFNNARNAALADPSLIYTEGVYVVLGNATAHAWCTAPDGEPVELTFPTDPEVLARSRTPYRQYEEGGRIQSDPTGGYAQPPTTDKWAYYGVEFPDIEFVVDCMERNGYACLIDLPECGYPLLRQPWTPTMRRLP